MKKIYLWVSIPAFLLAVLSLMLVTSDLQSPHDETVVMVEASVGLSRLPVYSGTSAYEMERASEHFSDVVLGWAVGPSVRSAMAPLEYTAQRQEKQNLLFKVYSDDLADGNRLVQTLNDRLADYNQETGAGYRLAVTRVEVEHMQSPYMRFYAGVLMLGFSLVAFFGLILRHATRD